MAEVKAALMSHEPNRITDTQAPVRDIRADDAPEPVNPGTGLCLSGGGYRAMVFHVGVLWRLNQVGYLKILDRISSVSGGSITAAVLALHWKDLAFDTAGVASPIAFDAHVVTPIRDFAGRTIDAKAIVGGALLPGSIGEKVAAAYDKYLFKGASLQDLPDAPRFVINSTNVQTGALWRFSQPYMADYRVGRVNKPTLSLALAVAASSAFPPVLSPLEIELAAGAVQPTEGADLHREPFTTNLVLTDGGVYDNLALETVWKNFRTVLVSDAGGKMQPESEPEHDWARHALRVLDLIDNQVRSLRKRQVIESFRAKGRDGAYWGVRTNIGDYQLPTSLPCPFDRTTELANLPTRLKRLEPDMQERLINWGYAVCDAAIRKHVKPELPAPVEFPYPGRGV
jgi:NTE family protein